MTNTNLEYMGETKPRNRVLAAVLTFLCPGLGYMYAGQLLKGITVNLLFLLLIETFVIAFSILKFFPLLPFLVVLAAWIVFSAFAASSVFKHIDGENPFVLRSYNHWTLYGLMFLFSFALPIYGTAHFVSGYLLGFNQVTNSAMLPSLKTGDVVVLDRSAYRNQHPRQGDLVAVRASNDEGVRVLRVVAVENDVVRIEGEMVYVNDQLLERMSLEEDVLIENKGLLAMVEQNKDKRYVISLAPRAYNAVVVEPTQLGENQLFVLADNRSQVTDPSETKIRDSRNFGAVSTDEVVGRPLYIGWSDGDAVRWNRIGLRVQ